MTLDPRWLRRSVFVLALPTLCAAGACARNEQMMAASGRTPAAEGTVTIERGDNGNTEVHVRVKHLAPPYRLASDATTYVVWVQPGDAAIQNTGALRVDDDLIGELEFVTPHRAFRVTVTPEASPTLSSPQNRPVFTARVDETK